VTRLEERYRRVLRLLPVSYREVWEEDMVSAFLASVEPDDREQAEFAADFGRPSWSEVASIVALAVRLRIGSAGAPPRYAAWGEAIRLAVLAGMLVNAAASMIGAVMTVWLAGMIPLAPSPVLPEPPGYPGSWHRVSMFTAVTGLLWLLAFLALVAGRWAAARRLGWAAAGTAMVSATLTVVVVTSSPMSGEIAYTLLINALLVLALAAFHRGTAPPRRRPWLAGFAACTVVVIGHAWLQFQSMTSLPPLDWAGLWCLVLVAVAVVHLARRRPDRFTAWTPALAILAFTVLGLRLATLLDFARFGSAGWHPATVPLAIGEAVAVAAAATVLVLLSNRTLRRLPATAAGATAWSAPTR
jgi:hypothetical protein